MILFITEYEITNKEQKFEYIFQTYYSYACKIAFNILNHADGVEDVVQDSFTNIWKTLSVITDEVSAKAWISTIVRNTAINARNKSNRYSQNILEIEDDVMYSVTPDVTCIPEEFVVSNQNVEFIYQQIKTLDKKYADILLLHYKFQFDPTMIASLLKMNPKTVYTRLSRGKEKLKATLSLMDRSIMNER